MSHEYLITINFTEPLENFIISNEKVYYHELYYDSLKINRNNLTIKCKRQKKKDVNTLLFNFNSSFNKQINKSLTFLSITNGFIPNIKNIIVSELNLQGKEITNFSTDKINQPLQTKLSDKLIWDLSDAKILLEENTLSHTILISCIYWLKAQDYDLEGGKFEKHWKSFNTLYTHISQKTTEFEKLVFMREFICTHKNLFPRSIQFISTITSTDIRNLRIREMILNDYTNENNTAAFVHFIKRYDDNRLNTIFKETLVYRQAFLRSKGLYAEVDSHINHSIARNQKNDEQLLVFYLIKYSYFIRNKYFHAEKMDSTFQLFKNDEIEELSLLNKIFSIFLQEILIAHSQY
ncbi:hypothetical protein DV702_08860 [Sporosarcina sp. PTS2304]|uniref:hypothetical protein n=1 Tax=Sporosarcina sp. PTS2304 TaxID=2283194 RepID=UPI000E0CDCDD|nr:hypothetical protein [Sporosarcina sp. PTS2304]AXH99836.1 hypothetical protein DV702_08860 [Sporosarcina sp. PTS2304]